MEALLAQGDNEKFKSRFNSAFLADSDYSSLPITGGLIMTKRSFIRIVSYIGFMLAIVIAAVIISTTNMRSYKQQLEVSYQQSLAQLSECLDNVNTDITKSLYSNSRGELYDLSRDLYAQCSTAKNAMSRLPIKQMEMNNAYKFLSQCSDYAQYIGQKIDSGEEISDNEHETLKTLLDYAQKFSEQANQMVNTVNSGAMITDSQVTSGGEINVSALSNGFSQGAKTFEDFPTLIYDGPFSDQILNKSSKLVSSADVYTKEQCKAIAAKALGVSTNNITFETDDKSRLPCYTFKCGRYTVSITKQGGYVKEILYSGLINSSDITSENACNLAISTLEKLGYRDMEVCYYAQQNNVCTVNCAYAKDGVRNYADLIKVGISLADGETVSLDAKTYLVNHTDRNLGAPLLTSEQAQEKLSKYLTVTNTRLCTIPKESGAERQCYEFTCTSNDTGENALVYINCDTGVEEDILIMLNLDNGTMVK